MLRMRQRRCAFARRAGHGDVATEADDVVEFQLLGQHLVEVMIAESAIGNDAHLDVRRQHRPSGQALSGLYILLKRQRC